MSQESFLSFFDTFSLPGADPAILSNPSSWSNPAGSNAPASPGMNAQPTAGAPSGGVNTFSISNLAGKGGALGASAIGLPPELGSIVGGFGGNIIGNALNKKPEETRAGERSASGWGKPIPNFKGIKFVFAGHTFELQPNWVELPNTAGYPFIKDGKQIDHMKYAWIENGSLYIQNVLAPWDETQTAGPYWVYNPATDSFTKLGWGTEPNPKAFTGIVPVNAPVTPQQQPGQAALPSNTPASGYTVTGGGNMSTNQALEFLNRQNIAPPTPSNNGILPGENTGMPKTETKASTPPKTGEKESNTTTYVIIGVVVLALIITLFFALRK